MQNFLLRRIGGLALLALSSACSLTTSASVGTVDASIAPADGSVDAEPGARASVLVADQLLTCALGDDARVYCWGHYTGFVYSQVRDAGATPTAVPGIEGATALAVSMDHACAVVAGGEVRCWGFNTWGHLGLPRENPDTTDPFHAMPVHIEGLAPARDVAVGWLHSCAVLTDGRVACWGDDGLTEMPVPVAPGGLGTYTATPVIAPDLVNVVQLDAHASSTCARLGDGTLHCWGENAYREDGPEVTGRRINPINLTNPVDVFTTSATSAGIDAMGTVYQWGSLVDLAEGDGLAHVVGSLPGATRVVAFSPHVCALGAGGMVGCIPARTTVVDLPEFEHVVAAAPPARQVAFGYRHGCAIGLDGTLSCWGENPDGEVGTNARGTRTAADAIVALHGASHVTRGFDFACAIAQGGVQCWGGNRDGDVGVGLPPSLPSPAPQRLAIEGTVTDVSARLLHACAVGQGNVYCWGDNGHGEVSLGGPASIGTPTHVMLPAPASTVAVGDSFACAVTTGGVYCWGDDSAGEAGVATWANAIAPTRVALPADVVSLTAGSSHVCAALTTGAVYCWGDNHNGQVGAPICDAHCDAHIQMGDAQHAFVEEVPIPVAGVSGVHRVVALDRATCAFDDAGAWCWRSSGGLARITLAGAAYAGAGGGSGADGVTVCASSPGSCISVTSSVPPVIVAPADHYADMAFDANSGCVISASGELRCWGDGSRGQLGTGDGYYVSPVPVRW